MHYTSYTHITNAYVHTYIYTYICTYVHTYVPTYIHTILSYGMLLYIIYILNILYRIYKCVFINKKNILQTNTYRRKKNEFFL